MDTQDSRTDLLQTARLTLRPFVPDDALPMHAMFCSPEPMRYCSRLPHTDMSQTMAVLAQAMADNADGRADNLAVLMDSEFVGYAGVWCKDDVSFMFVRKVWGTGIVREALSAVIARARERGHTRMTADVDPCNIRSLQRLKQLGFVVTGTAKNTWILGDTLIDSVYLERKL